MNLSAGGTMVLRHRLPRRQSPGARKRPLARSGFASAVDLFADVGGDPDAMTIIEVNANPSIRLLEQSGRGDLILKIWHHTFSAMGLLWCLTFRNTATAFAWHAWPNCSMLSRHRSRTTARRFGRGDRLERQGGSTAALCAAIGRASWSCEPACSPRRICYRFNERIRIDGAEIGDDASGAPEVIGSRRPSPRLHSGVASSSAPSKPLFALACLHFEEHGCEFVVFEAGIGGRYDPGRAWSARCRPA